MVPRLSEPPMGPPTPSPSTMKPLPRIPSPEKSPIDLSDISQRATVPEAHSFAYRGSSLPAPALTLRPRTQSPFTRGHTRSRSSGSLLRAPQMARAQSSPVPDTTGSRLMPRSSSPLSPPSRHRSPMRKASEESFSSFGNQLDIDLTISENSALDTIPRPVSVDAGVDTSSLPLSPQLPSSHQTFPRSRRRPPSPLNQINQSTFTPKRTLRASTSSPSLMASQFNESYPSSFPSSIPSTPTSIRSRSPSISSLETIPDSPDAEIEAEMFARLKAAADRDDQSEEGMRRRMSVGNDLSVRGGRDKRKRWSVCGAERRGDLDLETIWED